MDTNIMKRNEYLAKTGSRDWNPVTCPVIMQQTKKMR